MLTVKSNSKTSLSLLKKRGETTVILCYRPLFKGLGFVRQMNNLTLVTSNSSVNFLVYFGDLVILWLLYNFCHQNTKTQNITKTICYKSIIIF